MAVLGNGFFDTFSLGELYTAHPYALDSVLYLILFLGIARVTLGRHYHGRGGKAIVGSVGTILAVAASLSAHRSGFTLASLAPVAWVLFGLVLLLVFLGLIDLTRSTKPAMPGGQPGADQPTVDHHSHRTHHTHSTHTRHHTHDTNSPPFNTSTILEDDSAMTKILAAFIQYLHSHPDGLNQHASTFLIQIARTRRRSDRHYKQLLTALARSGWRADPDKKSLAADVEAIIQAMFGNNALFIEAMRIAEAAIHGQNLTLLIEAVTRMQQFEQEAIKLASQLRELTERMARNGQATQSAEHTVFTRGSDSGR